MGDGIAMRTPEALRPKSRLMFLRSHGLYPSTDHSKNNKIPKRKLPSGHLMDYGPLSSRRSFERLLETTKKPINDNKERLWTEQIIEPCAGDW